MRLWFRFCISILACMAVGILPAQVNSVPAASKGTTFQANPRAGTPTSLKYTISTIAGTGRSDYSGDSGPAVNADLTAYSVAVDNSGNLYIADHDNGRIRKVDPSGTITTVVGGGTKALTDGLPCTNANPGTINAVTVDNSGNVYFLTTYGLFRCDTTGFITGLLGEPTVSEPNDVVLDSAGNLYFSNVSGGQVLKLSPAGVLRTVAGTGSAGYTGDNGLAINAQLSSPNGIAVDSAGNLFIADGGNNVVRKVDTSGVITTVAGNGKDGYVGDGGPATSTPLYNPQGVAVDSVGNLFIGDNYNCIVRVVDASGIINTVAGTPDVCAESGDGGPATSAKLASTTSLAVDRAGRIYIADRGDNRVRLLTPAEGPEATISSLSPSSATAGGPAFALTVNGSSFTNSASVEWNSIALATTFVSATQLTAQVPASLIAATAGASITVLNPAAAASNSVTFNIGPASPRAGTPTSLKYTISTVAGTGRNDFSGDNGPAVNADLSPTGVAVDNAGSLYIADHDNGRIRKVDPSGAIATVVGGGTKALTDGLSCTNANPGTIGAVTVDGAGNLYFITSYGLFKCDTSGFITGLLGEPTVSEPNDVVLDSAGNLYFSNVSGGQVLKLSPAGVLRTVAGTGSGGYSGDHGPAINAQLSSPNGIAVDSAGNLFIADGGNNVVRKVDTSGIITTVAGNGKDGYVGDGGPAVSTPLYNPQGVAVDSAGNLLIGDNYNCIVRVVDASGIINTVAGTPGSCAESGDGGPATSARLASALSLAVDAAGRIYIADRGNNRVRLLTPLQAPPPPTPATIASLSPASATVGGPAFTLTVNGSAFANGASVHWNSTVLTTTFISATQLTAQVPASLIAATGTAAITVLNPGAAASNPITFTISSPQSACTPTGLLIQVISPQSGFSATAGQTVKIAVEVVDNCGVVTSGAATATFSNGDAPTQLASIGQGNYAGAWSPSNAGQRAVVITLTAFETLNPGHILTAQTAISGSIQTVQPPQLLTSVASLTFTQSQHGAPVSQPLGILVQGGNSASFNATASVQSGSGWLSVSPSAGAAPATLTVTADPGNLTPGTYSGTIAIGGGSQPVPPVAITMTVGAAKPILLLSQTALSFTAVVGGGAPLPQDFGILNIGQGSMTWTAQASVLSGSVNWLSLSSTSGTVKTPFLDVSPVDLSVNAAGLTPGTYYGQIQVASPGVDNSPLTISVVLTVLPAGSNPGPEIRPTGIIFAGPQNSNPSPQSVMISNTSAKPSLYGSNTVTLPGVPTWFSNSPSATTITPTQPLTMTVSPDFSHLSPGATRGQVSLLFDDGSSRTIALLAVIPPAATSTGNASPHANGCTPSQINIQWSGAQLPLSVSVGQPVTIDVLVVDSCGQNVTSNSSASVLASYSNGDPSGAMVNVGNGRWVRTWQPQRPSAPSLPAAAAVTAFVVSVNGAVLAGQIDIPVTFGQPSRVPIVNSGGVLNAASYQGTVVAPGSLITIYGANLAQGAPAQSATAPLPLQLGQTNVLLAGRQLPLLYTSDGQVNAQAPYDLPLNVPTQLVVETGGTQSVPEPLAVAPAQPAIFTVDQSGGGQGVIVGVTNVIADRNAPVSAGDTLVIYCTGLGAVTSVLPPGVPSTGPTSTLAPVSVTIGGQSSPQVTYAGLTPGYPGLYQVNAVVPPGVSGNAVPVVLTVDGQTSPPVTISVK